MDYICDVLSCILSPTKKYNNFHRLITQSNKRVDEKHENEEKHEEKQKSRITLAASRYYALLKLCLSLFCIHYFPLL